MRIERRALILAVVVGVVILVAYTQVSGMLLIKLMDNLKPNTSASLIERIIPLFVLMVPALLNYVLLIISYAVIGGLYVRFHSGSSPLQAKDGLQGGLFSALLAGLFAVVINYGFNAIVDLNVTSKSVSSDRIQDFAMGLVVSAVFGCIFGAIGGGTAARDASKRKA